MRKTAIAGCAIMGLFSLFLVPEVSFAAEQKGGGEKALIERGQYLVTVGGCNDCHSPKKNDPERSRA
jgi:mono/diheme cytochrome c family protein